VQPGGVLREERHGVGRLVEEARGIVGGVGVATQGIEHGQVAAVVCEIAQAAAALPRRRGRDGAAGGGGGRGRRDLEIVIS
jgi:hypothetical protein